MSHSRFTRTPGLAAIAVSASLSAATAQAGPVEIIYSAENALYGAGYDIGKADGWMDDTLRSAIRRYQSRTDELKATGNLDPQTLSALGIAHGGVGTISDNAVPNRNAAMAALGLGEQRFGSGSSTSRPVAAALKPEVRPQSDPDPEPEAEPALPEEPETKPTTDVAAISEQEPRQESSAPVESEPAPAPRETAASTLDEPTKAPTREPAAEPEPQPEPQRETTLAAEPEDEAAVEVATAEEPSGADSELPDEPTAAGPPEASEPAEVAEPSVAAEPSADSDPEPTTQSSGGFFSSLFDFLFGWLI